MERAEIDFVDLGRAIGIGAGGKAGRVADRAEIIDHQSEIAVFGEELAPCLVPECEGRGVVAALGQR